MGKSHKKSTVYMLLFVYKVSLWINVNVKGKKGKKTNIPKRHEQTDRMATNKMQNPFGFIGKFVSGLSNWIINLHCWTTDLPGEYY